MSPQGVFNKNAEFEYRELFFFSNMPCQIPRINLICGVRLIKFFICWGLLSFWIPGTKMELFNQKRDTQSWVTVPLKYTKTYVKVQWREVGFCCYCTMYCTCSAVIVNVSVSLLFLSWSWTGILATRVTWFPLQPQYFPIALLSSSLPLQPQYFPSPPLILSPPPASILS